MSNAGLKKLVAGVAGRGLSVCFVMSAEKWVRLSSSEGRTGVSSPFDRFTYGYGRRCTAFGIQRAMELLSIWLIMRLIRERIGVEGGANLGESGHFKSVDSILE